MVRGVMNDAQPTGEGADKAAEPAKAKSRAAGSSRINPKSPSDALRPERAPGPPPRSQQARHPIVMIMNFAMTIIVVSVLGAAGLFFFGKMRFEERSHFDQPRTVLIDRGTLVAEGTPGEVLTPANLEAVYGIRARVELGGDWPTITALGRSR